MVEKFRPPKKTNSAAIDTVAGHETVAFQRFNNVSQIGIPTGRINQPGSETASRPYSPFEDYYSLADVRSQWSFNGGLTLPHSPARTSSEFSFRTRDPPSPIHNNKANDSMLRINSSLFKHGQPIRSVSNPRFGNIDPIKQLRSIRVQMQPETLVSIRKQNENFTKNGPPILEDNCTLLQFQDWQNELFQFVERLPGYIPGMLFIQPEYSALASAEERENVQQLYRMVHGYLFKAGSKNSRIKVKTTNVPMFPFPDVVLWWKVVNDAFSLSPREIEIRYEKLITFHQHSSECCKDYCTRFEKAATELTNLGKSIPPDEQGYRVYTGLRSKYRQIIYNHMTSQHVPCTISNMTDMCKHADEMSFDRDDDIIDISTLTANQAAFFSNDSKTKGNHYGPSANNYPKKNSDTVGQKRSRDEPHNNSASKHPSHDKQSDNSKNHSNRQNDGKKKGRNRKPGKNKQVDQTGSHDNSNKHGNKPSQQSINPNANSAVVYQTVPAFNPSPTQVQGKSSRHSSIDLGNPPPGMQYAIFPNGQHGWVPSTTQPIFLSPPSSHSAAPQPMANLPNSRSVQQYSNQQHQWRNDTTRGSSRGNTQSQFDNMIANAVSDSNAISTPYDNDNVDGSDYPYLADIFYTLVSEDVFTRIFAYYKFMNTDLLAAYYRARRELRGC